MLGPAGTWEYTLKRCLYLLEREAFANQGQTRTKTSSGFFIIDVRVNPQVALFFLLPLHEPLKMGG